MSAEIRVKPNARDRCFQLFRRCATRKEESTFNAIEAEVAILLDSIRPGRDDKALLAFCERAAKDDAADEADRAAVELHDPALNQAFNRVRRLLVAVGSI